MTFAVKFFNITLNQKTFLDIHKGIIESMEDCLVHDCSTETGFKIQIKPKDYKVKGRVELDSTFSEDNIINVSIEKEFQTTWALDIFNKIVDFLQQVDESFAKAK